jgi:transposase
MSRWTGFCVARGAIQRTFARRHLDGGHLVLYDITSVYFEGEYKESELARFGYNRDGNQER